MMKKLMMLTALALMIQTAPVLANDYSDAGGKGKMFEKHDADGDGVISKVEFLNHAEERFDKMDADGNGSVSQEEGKEARENMREKMKEKREKWKERKESSGE
ncbi:MAG: hypothetical protein AAF569_01525 [Pseudomonadota bacterium]